MNKRAISKAVSVLYLAGGVVYAFVIIRLALTALDFLQFIIAQPESFYTNKMLFLLIALFGIVMYMLHWAIKSCQYLLTDGLHKTKEAWYHEDTATRHDPPRHSRGHREEPASVPIDVPQAERDRTRAR